MSQLILLITLYYLMVNHLKSHKTGNKLTIKSPLQFFQGKVLLKRRVIRHVCLFITKKNYITSINIAKKLIAGHVTWNSQGFMCNRCCSYRFLQIIWQVSNHQHVIVVLLKGWSSIAIDEKTISIHCSADRSWKKWLLQFHEAYC